MRCRRTTERPSISSDVTDVPVDAFWSVSVYNAAGYFEKNSDQQRLFAEHYNGEEIPLCAVTITLGSCDGKTPNCLPIMPGWNYSKALSAAFRNPERQVEKSRSRTGKFRADLHYRHVGEARRSPTLVRDAQNNGHTSEAAKRTRMTQQRHGATSHLCGRPPNCCRAAWKGPDRSSRQDSRSDQSADASITLMDEVVSVTQSRRRPAREIKSAYSR